MVMKDKKPMEFKRYVKDKCVELLVKNGDVYNVSKHINDSFWEKLYESDACLPYINKLKQALKVHQPPFSIETKEPFATVIHNDVWTKNIFIQFVKNKPNSVSFIDFRKYIYGSPISDVLNLLLTSSEYSVMEHHFDGMLKYYHDSLIGNLQKYHVDTQLFGWDKFLAEIKNAAVPALLKALLFLLEVVYEGEQLRHLPCDCKQRFWLLIQQFGSNGWL